MNIKNKVTGELSSITTYDPTTGAITGLVPIGNTTLGSNANVIITGGNVGEVLTTDGAGNLSWSAGGGGGSYSNVDANAFMAAGLVGDIIPAGNNVANLGSSAAQFKDLFLSNSTIYFNSIPLSVGTANGVPDTLLFNSQPVVTNDGNTVISTTGNIDGANISANGTITANGNIVANTGYFFVGDGGLISNLTIAAGTAITDGTTNVEVTGSTGIITMGANGVSNVAVINESNATFINNVIASQYYYPNGDPITVNYGNSNVFAYLQTYTGDLPNVGNIVADNVTANTGYYFVGDGSLLTGTYANANAEAYLPGYTGNLDSVDNITASGNLVAANLDVTPGGSIAFGSGGNVYAIPTGGLTGTVTVNGVNDRGISLTAGGTTPGSSYSQIQWVQDINAYDPYDPAGSITNWVYTQFDGTYIENFDLLNAPGYNYSWKFGIDGQMTAAGNITTPGNISANYFIGDGSQLTGLPTGYANSDVANYLASNANVVVTTTGNITTTANIQANYFIGNGSQLTGLPASYANSNVAAYLPTYTGNLGNVNSITASGNITGGDMYATGILTLDQTFVDPLAVKMRILVDGDTSFIQVGNGVAASTGNLAFAPWFDGTGRVVINTGTGNITAGNVNVVTKVTANSVSLGTGNLQLTGNIISSTADTITIDPLGDGTGAGNLVVQGNMQVAGTLTYNNIVNATTNDLQWIAANNAINQAAASGGGLSVGPAGAYAAFTYNSASNVWQSSLPLVANGGVTANGALSGATTGSFSGNVTANYFIGNGSQLTGLPASYTDANVATYLESNSNVNIETTGTITTLGNISTGEDITATGNVTANFFIGDGGFLSNISGSGGGSNIANGTSSLGIDTVDGNISITLQGSWAGRIGTSTVAIGTGAGNSTQFSGAVAVGVNAGGSQQAGAVAIGSSAGRALQNANAIAIGVSAGISTQSANSIAIGANAASNIQGADSIAIGVSSGANSQGLQSIAIGVSAGANSQSANSIAIGVNAGAASQGANAVAIGDGAGSTSQGVNAVAIGDNAGQTNQLAGAVAIGRAGTTNQQANAVAIGFNTATTSQGANAIAIGTNTGGTNQAANSIAIGANAQAAAAAIVLNATGGNLLGDSAGFYVAPVRNDTANVSQVVTYNTTSKEVTYANTISIAGNITTAGRVTATGNITAGNISTSGTIAATNIGNITPINLNGNAASFLNGSGVWSSTATVNRRNITKVEQAYGYGNQFIIADGRLYIAKGVGNDRAWTAALSTNQNVPLEAGINNMYEVPFINEIPGTVADAGIYGISAYALMTNGNLYTWGYNGYGQLGLGNTTNSFYPTLSNTNVAQVYTHPSQSASVDYSVQRLVIRKTNNTFFGCGHDGQGQLGLGTTTPKTSWTQLPWIPANVLSVWNLGGDLGSMFIQLANGLIQATGWNGRGQLGVGTYDAQFTTPVNANLWLNGDTTMRIQSIGWGGPYNAGGGQQNYCNITMFLDNGTTSRIATAGDNNWGAIGNGTTTNSTSPIAAVGIIGRVVKFISMGQAPRALYALTSTGNLYAWGYNESGQLGTGTTAQQNSPTIMAVDVLDIMGECQGWNFYGYYVPSPYIRKSAGYFVCGYNQGGSLGDGTQTQQNFLVRLRVPPNVVFKYFGTYGNNNLLTRIGITTDNAIWAWGYNGQGTIDQDEQGWYALQPLQFSPAGIDPGTSVETITIPTFSVVNNGTSVTITAAYTYSQVPYATVEVDTNSWYSVVTNRYTPQRAGWYQINATARLYVGSDTPEGIISIRKNGNNVVVSGSFGATTGSVSKLVYCNGTTDYIDVAITNSEIGTASQNSATTFNGFWVRY
jgi:alpha-tubulin suppressor-like RCC1 family protein